MEENMFDTIKYPKNQKLQLIVMIKELKKKRFCKEGEKLIISPHIFISFCF